MKMENQETVTITNEEYRNLIEDSVSMGILVTFIQEHVEWDDIMQTFTVQNSDLLLEIVKALGYSAVSHAMKKAREDERGFYE
jgi:methionine synthase II (cobalamin-independent)